MVTVGQSPWDDIKILGPQLGHLISIFWAMWDTYYSLAKIFFIATNLMEWN